jgi:hypothetical protein
MAKVEDNAVPVPVGIGTEAAGSNMLWTAKDVAAYLRTSVSWVYQKAESGLMPCLPRMPGSNFLRFDTAAVKAYARGSGGLPPPFRSQRFVLGRGNLPRKTIRSGTKRQR